MPAREAFPILLVADVERAAAFYCDLLGFERGFRWPVDGELEFVFLRLPPLGIGIVRGERTGEAFALCVYVDNADDSLEPAQSLGAEVVRGPRDEPWGERMADVRDLDGNTIVLTQKL